MVSEQQAAGSNFVACFWVTAVVVFLSILIPQREQVGSCLWVPPPPPPGSTPALSAEISHPGWPMAEPKLEAEVLGVGAGRRERILSGYEGEQLGGRPEDAGEEMAD